MELVARQVMQTDVRTVSPDMKLPELYRLFFQEGKSGFPVVREGKLVGLVSRADVIRQLCVEQSTAEMIVDWHREEHEFKDDPARTLKEIGERVGRRIEEVLVEEIMKKEVITASPDQPISEVARILVDRRFHRVPVTEGQKLVGLLTTFDLTRLFADGRVRAAP